MEPAVPSPRSARVRHLRLVISVLAIGLVAATALIVPHVMHTAHAAPKPANTCAQPPVGKDPTTFTPAQLKQYGLPPLSPGQDKTQWAAMLLHAKHRNCSSHSLPSINREHTSTSSGHLASSRGFTAAPHEIPAAPSRFADSVCNQCLTGADASIPQQGPFGYDFAMVQGNWNVPCISNPEDGSAFGQWVNIGSPTNSGIIEFSPIQVGMQVTTQDQTYTIRLPGGRTIFYTVTLPVYTAYVTDGNQVQSFSVNCGDHIGAMEDLWDGTLFVLDISTNNYAEMSLPPTPVSQYAGCYVDDPNGGAQDLMDFGTATFTKCTMTDEGEGELLFMHSIGEWISDEEGGPIGAIQGGNGPMADVVQPLPDTFNTTGEFSVQWSAAN